MFFTYDNYKNIQKPDVYLAYPNKRIICTLKVYELNTKLSFNAISSASFKIYRYENGEEIPYWNKIKMGLYIEIRYISWFYISNIKLDKDENGNEYMEIDSVSLESTLCQTLLTSFGSLGIDSDEQGGLDRYCLYNIMDQDHSIMHIFKQKNPAWTIGYIDPEISRQYRAFNIDTITSYEMLTDKVSEIYECLFQFNVYDMSVNIYKLENIGNTTSIFLSDRNLIKSVSITSDDSDIKTMFNVSGGNDSRTNTTLGIADVNPSGNNTIVNLGYYENQMSPELVSKLTEYSIAYEASEENYIQAIAKLENLYEELENLKNKVPNNHDSTNWTLFGLIELEEKQAKYWNNMSIYMNIDKSKYDENYNLHESVSNEISIRKSQINAKENQIKNQIQITKSYIINIQDFLGDKLYNEMSLFIREQDFQDDSFVVTTEMTSNEILEMQKELMEHAQKELAKVSYPQFEMSIDLINFTTSYDYIKYTEQLELGNIITIEWEQGILIEARLLEMDIDWDNSENFTLKFSNKNSLNEKWALLSEIRKQANSTASSVDYNKGAWNIAKQTSIDFTKWKGSILDASLQALQNSANQEVLMDETGIILRRWLPDQNKYSPNQIWMTNGQIAFSRDGWKSVCQALGELTLPDGHVVYGLVGEYIIGEIFIGETLRLRGSGAELDLSANVAITDLENKNVEFSVTINEFKSEYSAYKKEMSGTVEKINTSIKQNEQAITLEANKRIEADNGLKEDYNSKFTITNETISAEVRRATQAEGTLKEDYTAKFKITSETISAEVNRATQAENGLKEDYNSKFSITSNAISAEVNRATQAEGNLSSSIKVNADNIALKVNKNGIISAINISPETVKIAGKKIQLDGEVTFSNTNKFKLEPNTTTINGGCITTGTIDASKANIRNINADNINTGSFNASLIKTGTLDANLITVKNLVVGENVSMGENATISWGNVTGTKNVAELDDIPDDKYITQITKNTITTEYINALGITAKYIEAGAISADNISGGILKGVTALFTENNGAYWACGTSDLSQVNGKYCDWICDTNALSAYDGRSNTIRLTPSSGIIECEQIMCNSRGTRDDASVYCYNIWASDIECSDIDCSNIDCTEIYSSVAGDTWSDYRLKNKINPLNLETMRNIILSLTPVSYELNQFKGRLHFGLIAQEVEKILKKNKVKSPVVYSIRDNGYYALAYDELIPPIISTLQYQNLQLNQLKDAYIELKQLLS